MGFLTWGQSVDSPAVMDQLWQKVELFLVMH